MNIYELFQGKSAREKLVVLHDKVIGSLLHGDESDIDIVAEILGRLAVVVEELEGHTHHIR